MPYAESEGVRLYYEETGQGEPLVFVHEFGDDMRSWEGQINYFCRRYRCIAFNARGYPPSDVPEDPAAYSQDQATDDIIHVLNHLKIEKAHIVGLSMGSFATLHVGLRYPERTLSLTVAGGGYGALSENHDQMRREALERAEDLEKNGFGQDGGSYALGVGRLPFKKKDPRGWASFAKRLSEHSPLGSALTLRGVQANRPSFWALESGLRKLQVPVLIVAGDEDEPSLEPSLFLKQIIPSAALWVFPKSGHSMNLEEPSLFNKAVQDFLSTVSAQRWEVRDLDNQPKRMV